MHTRRGLRRLIRGAQALADLGYVARRRLPGRACGRLRQDECSRSDTATIVRSRARAQARLDWLRARW